MALNVLPSHHLLLLAICNAYFREQLKAKFKPRIQENPIFLSFCQGSIKQNH